MSLLESTTAKAIQNVSEELGVTILDIKSTAYSDVANIELAHIVSIFSRGTSYDVMYTDELLWDNPKIKVGNGKRKRNPDRWR